MQRKIINSRPIPERLLDDLLGLLAECDDFVFLETVRVSEDNQHSFLFLDPVEKLICRAEDDPIAYLDKVQAKMAQGFYVVGWLAYEFGYKLEPVLSILMQPEDGIVAELGVYRFPHVFDHASGRFTGNVPGLQDSAEKSSPKEPVIEGVSFSQEKEDYLQNIARIKSFIETGDTYQVNYTLKLLFEYSGADASLYRALRRNQSVSYGAFIRSGNRRIMSFSPELFFRKKGNICQVRPMKGTMRRAPDPETDLLIGGSLAHDVKNRSENVMIVDLLRNDLGRLCRMGTVDVLSLFDVETYETLHQMTSSVRGELRPEVGLADLFRAIFPCGSVTGAPKIRTMEIIRELEADSRGVYTGGIGFFTPGGDAVFNVPIRTVVLDGMKGEMGIGSGIVYDSDPEREWEECSLKGRFLVEPEPDFQLIETILCDLEKGFWLIGEHLERLFASASYWGIPCDPVRVRDELLQTAVSLSGDAATGKERFRRVRLLLHKDGRVEISSAPCSPPRGYPDPEPAEEPGAGRLPKVVLAKERTSSHNPFLYHKTTRRELYDQCYKMAGEKGYFEALFVNERDEVTEGCITNLFVRRGQELITPPVNCGLLNGVLRRALLTGKVATPDNLPIREAVIGVSELVAADEIYLGNSVRGLVKVQLVAGPL
ncbi:MAG: aminodeoxychorismate synthase component I [Proteobacteria bacterium]|nr:aminodeoxychorismate synthase component I [Pseudomonadota bacterium]MBU1736566.1 aminodeoxychorismate synthase component I [Pseudomonadota bacterium]